ncbi:MAG: 50S ribosomal protein L4 [Patescibacteria group bacterium]
MPVKKKVTSNKRQVTSSSLRAKAKQSKKEIATSASGRTLNDKLSIPVYSLAGRASGRLSLSKEIFGQEVNKTLLAQALRVYMTNQKRFTAKTKTRGEVQGSTAKIYRQKGTGRARHGARTAPIFVGGGITFGPKPRRVRLDLPKKMKKRALISALSAKANDKEIVGITGVEKATGKTKEIADLAKKLNLKSALIVTDEKQDNIVRAARNIPGISVLPTNQLNAYDILRHQVLVVTKDGISKLGGKGEKK